MYKLARPIIPNGESQAVCKLDTNLWIPKDSSNTDYKEYLEWVAAGNTPEPADTPE
jgi:hypothetical protein